VSLLNSVYFYTFIVAAAFRKPPLLPNIPVNIIPSLFHSKSCFASFTFPADDNAVTLTEFEASAIGMVKSFITRFPGDNSVLEDLWKAEMPYHKL